MSTSALPSVVRLKADFDAIVARFRADFLTAPSVDAATWQSTKAPQPMPELFNVSFRLDLNGVEELKAYQEAIRPNLPWADNHFRQERVSGEPINPGETWKEWPYARSADTHRTNDEQFDHSYAERYWPKHAGMTSGGHLKEYNGDLDHTHRGVRFEYGDLGDLVHVLGVDPLTRQGYLPVWFPEDLAAARDGKRVPCTLGYHFIRRGDRFHCVYPMRSCDFIRHFRDDVYLTIRLQLWLLSILKFKYPETWAGVLPGTFTMHITSLHMFEQDRVNLLQSMKQGALK